MERYLEGLRGQAVTARVAGWLPEAVARPALHARLLNALARMEYVGVRKMLKARRAEGLDVDGLQHALEECGHALRLKKAALAVAGDAAAAVATFADAHCLGGAAGEDYLQAVDRACEALLGPDDGEVNYLLSSAVIELRALTFYPLYERALRDAGVGPSLKGLLADEEGHLAEMGRRLAGRERLVERALAAELPAFEAWEAALGAAVREGAAAAV